ncbi:MAG: peptidylprolyl isomerase [Candidatus Aenigmarchaeota archaeon]|nr:peptidylprolyl isomerase [Candidatus Aenigmarchaeota archaeon]
MNHGDFIKIDFLGKIVSTGQIFDFTQEEVAKKEGLHNTEHKYVPALVIIGDNMVIPGVEKHLKEMKIGEEKEFTVPPEEAFGPRNPKLVKLFPMSAFIKQNINPVPGAFVEIEKMRGKVQSAAAGRVRVDFNHPLAGKELEYWIKITAQITTAESKVSELFSYYSIPHTPEIQDAALTIETDKPIPHEMKSFIEEIIAKWVKSIKTVKFSEKKEK